MGGLDRPALHAQLIGAVQVVLMMRRGQAGRRLAEIAVLERGPDGLARLVTAVADGEPVEPGWQSLGRLLSRRAGTRW